MIGENWFGPSHCPQTGEPEGSKSLRDVLYHVTDCCSRLPELRQSGQVPSSCHNCFGPGEVFYWISSILLFKKASIFNVLCWLSNKIFLEALEDRFHN